MEKPRLEARFDKAKEGVKSSKSEIRKFLGAESLSEKDRIRLTRVLQLIERYEPSRAGGKGTPFARWKPYLESIFRSLPLKKKQKGPGDPSARSYLAAEKAVASLRELRHLDLDIRKEPGFKDDEILDQKRPEKLLKEEVRDTSLTLEYEKKNWGVERVCLDGIQNHLPEDSKGERVWIRCLVEGRWVSLDEARVTPGKIKGVRFADDGVGFDVKNLSLFYSTKSEEKESAGGFGEGMKMMAAAALREGLEPEIESQNWRSYPIPQEVEIFDTRHQKTKKVQQLAFKVQYLDGVPMIGSRTTFWHPTKKFVDELLRIEDKVLPLRPEYRPLFAGSHGEIAGRESGNIFVKGIFVMKKETLFSYNFEDVEINRDRNAVVSEGLERRIASIIQEIPSKHLAKTFLKKSILEPDAIECNFYGMRAHHPRVWVDGFQEAFGQDAVLDTGFKIPDAFQNKPINRIKLPHYVASMLIEAGVAIDRKAIPDFYEETIPTSLTFEYGRDMWGEERILLDSIQNHLPKDSGGSAIGLRFKTKDGEWHAFDELPSVSDDTIEAVRISDNGRGYDAALLGLFYSTKGEGEAGKFGEGLKMLCAAALRRGIDIRLHSRNWTAKPRGSRQKIEGKQIDQLVFDVTRWLKDAPEEDRKTDSKSSTTFTNPTPQLIREFRQINKKVLAIEKTEPVEEMDHGEILALQGGSLYVRELLIPGDHNLLFSYHLPGLDIKNRDRSFVAKDGLAPAIARILEEIKNPEVVKTFLMRANQEAKEGEGDELLEFATSFIPRAKEIWKKAFEEMFGADTSIRDVKSQDFDAMHQNLHVGLRLVSFPAPVYEALKGLGLPTYESRLREMTDVRSVPEGELTPEEKGVIKVLEAIDEFLPNNRPSTIAVYERKSPDQKVAQGFSDGVNIRLLRETLTDFTRAADVYVHEKTHHNTGSQDAAADFRNYLTMALGKMALRELRKTRPELFL